MASSSSSSSTLVLAISISIFISFFSPSDSAITCATQKLSRNRSYTNCTDLLHLGATLHFTYNETNSSIAVAFAAAAPKSGWVAWGVNLAGGGMLGGQALIAYKDADKSVLGVHPYNLTAYNKIEPVKSFTFETWDVSAEEAGGAYTIYAALKVPETVGKINQIWQVGPLKDGKVGIHALEDENKKAVTALPVVATTAVVGGGNTTTGGTGNTTASGNKNGGAHVMGERFGLGFYLGLVLVMMSFITM